jgi:hypothetical protein
VAGSLAGVREGAVHGWHAVHLTTDALAVTVLPAKGADIYAMTDVASGIDPLLKTPWGLQPPGARPREGSDGAAFLENYEGTWQELFPNTNDACDAGGGPVPFHGEVATRPWDWAVEADDQAGVAVRFTIDCRTRPLRLERLMRLETGQRTLQLHERVTNLSAGPVQFVWGHHCVLGPPLVAAGAQLAGPFATITTPGQAWEESVRLTPGQLSSWPHAQLRAGGTTDLSRLPGPGAGSHDDVYLSGLAGGWTEVRNPGLGTGFRLDWDPALFRWLISWQPFGGALAMPLRGCYGLGVEPWTTGGNLEKAIADGDAVRLEGHAHLETELRATIFSC